jgi:hypothetical protein
MKSAANERLTAISRADPVPSDVPIELQGGGPEE